MERKEKWALAGVLACILLAGYLDRMDQLKSEEAYCRVATQEPGYEHLRKTDRFARLCITGL